MLIEEFIIFFVGDGFCKIKEWTHGINNEITAYKVLYCQEILKGQGVGWLS